MILSVSDGVKVKKMALVNRLEVGATPRLSDILFEKTSPSFGSIAALPSNVEAIESALLFVTGHADFVSIVGPSGWGKTHLLSAVEGRLKKLGVETAGPVSAEDFLENQTRLMTTTALLLDDCQGLLANPRPRHLLRLALEQRVRAGKPTMLCFTSPKVTRSIRSLLPQSREWTVCQLEDPAPEERELLIKHMMESDGLSMSPSLINILAHQVYGNGRTLAGALKRLRLSGSKWQDGESVLRACGLLEPFFADNSNWDLKDRIVRTVEACRAQLTPISATDLAVYLMLRIASLGESEVARSVGTEPAEAYLKAARFERELHQNPAGPEAVRRVADLVVSDLTSH